MRPIAELIQPWDAAWLASQWPDIFLLINGDMGLVEVRDVAALIRLSETSEAVKISWKDGDFCLCVFGACSSLKDAMPPSTIMV